MLRIAVCDDEVTVLHQTEMMLKEYETMPCMIDLYESGEELLKAEQEYDIILLDIDMKKLNGIETARKIREKDKNVKLIYATNYSDYTTFAFAVHAFAYLLKPLDQDELYHQLDEAVSYGVMKEETPIELITKEGVIHIKPSEIQCFEYLNREVLIHTGNHTLHMKARINEVAEKMKAYDYVMPHKSFVVNLYAVTSVHGYEIYLTDGTVIPLSQKKSVEFRKRLNQYLAGRQG